MTSTFRCLCHSIDYFQVILISMVMTVFKVNCMYSCDMDLYSYAIFFYVLVLAAEFGLDGRPFDCLFYTGKPNFYQMMHVGIYSNLYYKTRLLSLSIFL